MTLVVAEIINLEVLDHIRVVADGSREEMMYHPRHYLPRSCYSGYDRKDERNVQSTLKDMASQLLPLVIVFHILVQKEDLEH